MAISLCPRPALGWPMPCRVNSNRRMWSLKMWNMVRTGMPGTLTFPDYLWHTHIFQDRNQLLSKYTFFKRRLFYFNLPAIRRIQIGISTWDLDGCISHIVSSKLGEKISCFGCRTGIDKNQFISVSQLISAKQHVWCFIGSEIRIHIVFRNLFYCLFVSLLEIWSYCVS